MGSGFTFQHFALRKPRDLSHRNSMHHTELYRENPYNAEEDGSSSDSQKPSIKKPPGEIRRGEAAGVRFSKPPIPVAGNPIIDGVPDRCGDEDQAVEQVPRPPQAAGDPKRRRRSREASAPLDQDQTAQHGAREPVPADLFLSEC